MNKAPREAQLAAAFLYACCIGSGAFALARLGEHFDAVPAFLAYIGVVTAYSLVALILVLRRRPTPRTLVLVSLALALVCFLMAFKYPFLGGFAFLLVVALAMHRVEARRLTSR